MRPVDTETFYREVDEELRREQLMSMWKRYRNLAIAAVVLLIAAIGFFFWWQHHREQVAGERSAKLLSAFDDIAAGKRSDATAKLDSLAREKEAGPRAAGLLAKAALALASNDNKGAIAAYRQVADDKDLPQPYRDLALVRMTTVEFDTMKPQAVIDRLKPLAVPGNPWFGSAGELVAIAHLKLNQNQQAGRLFAQLARDTKVPDSIRARADQMAGSLGLEPVQQPGASQEGK